MGLHHPASASCLNWDGLRQYPFLGRYAGAVRDAGYGEALKACQAQGATVEGNTKAREQAAEAALAFLKKVFGVPLDQRAGVVGGLQVIQKNSLQRPLIRR